MDFVTGGVAVGVLFVAALVVVVVLADVVNSVVFIHVSRPKR